MNSLGEEGIHQQLEEQKEAPHQQEMHPVQQEMHPGQQEMHPAQQEMHTVQQEMHPVQYQQEMYPVLMVLSIVWQSNYGINYFTLQTLWIL